MDVDKYKRVEELRDHLEWLAEYVPTWTNEHFSIALHVQKFAKEPPQRGQYEEALLDEIADFVRQAAREANNFIALRDFMDEMDCRPDC